MPLPEIFQHHKHAHSTDTHPVVDAERHQQQQHRTNGHDANTQEISDKRSAHAQLQQIYAGGIAGALTRSLTQPFDVLKIRFQLQVEPVWQRGHRTSSAPSKYTSMLQASRLICKEEGVRGLFKGHNAGQFMSVVYSMAQFWSYEQIRATLRDTPFMQQHFNLMNFVAGGLAGCVAAIFSTPFDVIRTRLVAQDPGVGYRNTLHAIPHIWRVEGVCGYFRGLNPTMVQIVPLVGFNFMFYKKFNDIARHTLNTPDGLLPTWVLLCSGGAAGVFSKSLVYPLDFIKKRLQLQGFETHRKSFGRNHVCNGALHCVRLTLKEEGPLGFYKGMYPTLIKSGLTTALYFAIYDKFKLIFRQLDER